MAAVVLAADAVEGLHVDGVGRANGRRQLGSAQAAHFGMVLTSGRFGGVTRIVVNRSGSLVAPGPCSCPVVARYRLQCNGLQCIGYQSIPYYS